MTPKVFLFLGISFLFTFCNSKEKVAQTRPVNIPEGKVEGIVSHKYNNCGAVVVLKSSAGETVLIPFPELDKQYDSDGLTIQFNYRKLRMAHPGVCTTGVMAELSNIVKSN
jgi:hypothetical protein